MVPVHLHSKVTEVGTLELWCFSRDGKQRGNLNTTYAGTARVTTSRTCSRDARGQAFRNCSAARRGYTDLFQIGRRLMKLRAHRHCQDKAKIAQVRPLHRQYLTSLRERASWPSPARLPTIAVRSSYTRPTPSKTLRSC